MATPERDRNPQARTADAHPLLWTFALCLLFATLWSSWTMYARIQTANTDPTAQMGKRDLIRQFANLSEVNEDHPYQSLIIPNAGAGERAFPLCRPGRKTRKNDPCSVGRQVVDHEAHGIELALAKDTSGRVQMYSRTKSETQSETTVVGVKSGYVYDYAIPCSNPYQPCPLIDGSVLAQVVHYAFAPTRILWWASLSVVFCLLMLMRCSGPTRANNALRSGFGVPAALSMLLGARLLIALNLAIGDPEFAAYAALIWLELLLLPAACWMLMGRVERRKVQLIGAHALCIAVLLWAVSGEVEVGSDYHANLIGHLAGMRLSLFAEHAFADRGLLGMVGDAFVLELLSTVLIYAFAVGYLYFDRLRNLLAHAWVRWSVLLAPFGLALLSLLSKTQADERFHWFAFASLSALVFFCLANWFFSAQLASLSWPARFKRRPSAFIFLFSMGALAVFVGAILRVHDTGGLWLAMLVVALVVYPILFAGNTYLHDASSQHRWLGRGLLSKGLLFACASVAIAILGMQMLKLLYLKDFEHKAEALQQSLSTDKTTTTPVTIEAWMTRMDAPNVAGITDGLNPCRVAPGIGAGHPLSGAESETMLTANEASSLSADDIARLDQCFTDHAYTPVNSTANLYRDGAHQVTRLYAWLVTHPYDRLWNYESLGKLEGYQRAIAHSVPAADRWFWGDLTLPKSSELGVRYRKDGLNYEWLVGLYWIKPLGMIGVGMILIAFVLLFVSVAPANTLARLYVAMLGIASGWLLLQTQGVFPMIGQGAPLLNFSSFVGDYLVVLCPLLILLSLPPPIAEDEAS